MNNSNPETGPIRPPRLCFILGIAQRSGTNFTYQLLSKHPRCAAPGPIWEDHLLQYSDLLREYAAKLYGSWNPRWDVESKVGGEGVLLNRLGGALESYLRLQMEAERGGKAGSLVGDETMQPQILLTKTPSVAGIENFHRLFPNAYLIVLIRDGRALVESGVRSFDWTYEAAMHKWAYGARKIIQFKEEFEDSNGRCLFIKYEDLVTDQSSVLKEVFEFLGVSPDEFNYRAAENLGVTGSSDSRRDEGAVHWKETSKQSNFNPLERFHHWSWRRHERFNWIAGTEMLGLGYELKPSEGNPPLRFLRNRLLDASEFSKTIGSKILGQAFRNLRG